MKKTFGIIAMAAVVLASCSPKVNMQTEPYRPQFHFSPAKGWMNDPNGMVYHNGTYHLFFQHSPDTKIWGPMHWGHATSKDLVNWTEQPIALYPDSLGTIFSGSAVVDKENTAGFGKNALVAIFTYHNDKIEQAKTGLHQYQGIAYSTDEGKTWAKYKGNPVLPNPGIWDFRDPKVMWHEASKQWVMSLATKQSITFYGSKNLKQWQKLSEFGNNIGAHGGVWECPDLFSLSVDGITKWVLLVSINPGGPNGGSATQYFIGDFDGRKFIPDHNKTQWADYGSDNYAGVTWDNTGNRKVFIGWMNNWDYANKIPEQGFRGAMTIARELSLKKIDGTYFLVANPVQELSKIIGKNNIKESLTVANTSDLSAQTATLNGRYELEIATQQLADFELKLSNSKNDELLIGYDKANNNFYVDRTKSGLVDFEKNFAKKTVAPRVAKDGQITLRLILDTTSAELFADDGLTVITNTFFSQEPLTNLNISTNAPLSVKSIKKIGN